MLQAAARRVYEPGAELSPQTLRLRRRDGSLVWVESQVRVMSDEAGVPTGAALIMRDITERKRVEERLAELAHTDGLTGLANRRCFDGVLEREWQRTLREGSQMSLLLLDIDHFKKLNDEHGHQMGDDCLRAIARVLQSSIRAIDLAARYGGEEFAVILTGADAAAARSIAEAILTAIRALTIPHSSKSVRLRNGVGRRRHGTGSRWRPNAHAGVTVAGCGRRALPRQARGP